MKLDDVFSKWVDWINMICSRVNEWIESIWSILGNKENSNFDRNKYQFIWLKNYILFLSHQSYHTEKSLAQMLPLAVELLRLAEESCATMHLGMLHSLCGWAAVPFWGSSWLTSKEHSAPFGRKCSCTASSANAKAGESTNFKFLMIYMKVPIEMMFPVYI